MVKSIPVGGQKTRFLVTITSDSCQRETEEGRFWQMQLLQMMASQPDLTMCGMHPFERMKMTHTGQEWLVELEAVTDTPSSFPG